MNASAWYEALGLLHLNPGVTLSALDENYLYVAEHQSVSPFTRFLVLLPKPIAKNIVIQLSGEVKKQVIKELDQFQDSDETVLASRVQALTDLLT